MEDEVGLELLVALDEVADELERLLADLARRADLYDLGRDVGGNQLAGRALRDDLPVVHDDEAVAELLRLVHGVGRESERHALGAELPELLPDAVARLRVERRRGLVEYEEARLVDQPARDEDAPSLPAREDVDPLRGAVRELEEGEELVDPGARLLRVEVVVARVDGEVLAGRELDLEVVLLRDDSEPALHLTWRAHDVESEDREIASSGRARAVDHLHGRRLPGSVGSEEAEALSGADLEVDSRDGDEGAEPLLEAARADDGVGHGSSIMA